MNISSGVRGGRDNSSFSFLYCVKTVVRINVGGCKNGISSVQFHAECQWFRVKRLSNRVLVICLKKKRGPPIKSLTNYFSLVMVYHTSHTDKLERSPHRLLSARACGAWNWDSGESPLSILPPGWRRMSCVVFRHPSSSSLRKGL